tara:strand:+ start:906 stop:1124 length:219 start_codon:yes stop_codon:yes gene_type:complete
MTSLREFNLNIKVGDNILVGKHDEPAQITKIEYFDKSGDLTINTTRGPRKALTFKLLDSNNDFSESPADKYR